MTRIPLQAARLIVNNTTPASSYLGDPYLEYQPHFAFSIPVQIFCNGIILTLAAVLLIHLALTGTYHWALAKLNYILQLSAVVTLCTSLTATTCVVFSSLHRDSRGWPYMLDYIAVAVPPDEWNLAEKILWYCMEAITSGLAHITHIQLLTMMYPSNLEARLIFILIGPLAVASSAMQFCSLSPYQRAQDLGDAIRGVCNTTLALLFTVALFIWGFVVNKKRAWRTDGGTAAFGAAAMFLSVMSVTNNFVLIFVDNLVWLPSLNWAIVLWQTFLGWWWWVGAGMGVGEVEDMLYREQKRKYQRYTQQNNAGSEANRHASRAVTASKASRLMDAITPDSFFLRHRLRGAQQTQPDEPTGDGQSKIVVITSSAENEGISSSSISHALPGRPARMIAQGGADEIEMTQRGASLCAEGESIASDTTSATVIVPTQIRNIPFIPSIYTSCVLAIRALRRAHHTATQAEVRQSQATARDTGWGLGNYGLREREEAERRIRDFQAERRRRMLLREPDDEDDDEGWHDEEGGVLAEVATPSLPSHSGDEANPAPLPAPTEAHAPPPPLRHQESDGSLPHPFPPSDSLYWRWGPLRRWRLQDRTKY